MESQINIHPDICNGKPIIANTRIPVQTIMEFLGAGDSIEEVLEEYPFLRANASYFYNAYRTKVSSIVYFCN